MPVYTLHKESDDSPDVQRRIDLAIQTVRGEYLEIPGLLLTRAQVQRLWGFDQAVCDKVLDALLEMRFLQQTPGGAFVRR